MGMLDAVELAAVATKRGIIRTRKGARNLNINRLMHGYKSDMIILNTSVPLYVSLSSRVTLNCQPLSAAESFYCSKAEGFPEARRTAKSL
jgi:hypothetical protein